MLKSVVVFDRNSDPVRNNPQGIAEKLFSGEYKPFRGTSVNLPETVGVLSLWTRDPRNIMRNPSLNKALKKYKEMGILLELQISVTGFGGRFNFMELDVPTPEKIYQEVTEIINSELIDPAILKIRIDPVFSVKIPTKDRSYLITNRKLELFEYLADMFSPLGIKRFLSSHRDVGNYDLKKKRILNRFSEIGSILVEDSPSDIVNFFKKVTDIFTARKLNFGLCANPPSNLLVYQSCIDNDYYMKKVQGLQLSRDHNVDRNRLYCGCYRGVASIMVKGARCYSNARGCLICYSQGESLGKAKTKFLNAINKFKDDPSYFVENLIHPYDCMVSSFGGNS